MFLTTFFSKISFIALEIYHNFPSIIFALLLINLIIFIHEMGHYMVARYFNVGVDTFSVGMGPKLFGFYDKNNTLWQFCLIPIGGYVFPKFNDISLIPFGKYIVPKGRYIDGVKIESKGEQIDKSSPFVMFCVAVAGPLINYITAFFVAWIMLFCVAPDCDLKKFLNLKCAQHIHHYIGHKMEIQSNAKVNTHPNAAKYFKQAPFQWPKQLGRICYKSTNYSEERYKELCFFLINNSYTFSKCVDFVRANNVLDKKVNTNFFAFSDKVVSKSFDTDHYCDFNEFCLSSLIYGYKAGYVYYVGSIPEFHADNICYCFDSSDRDGIYIFYKNYIYIISGKCTPFIIDKILEIIKENHDNNTDSGSFKYFLDKLKSDIKGCFFSEIIKHKLDNTISDDDIKKQLDDFELYPDLPKDNKESGLSFFKSFSGAGFIVSYITVSQCYAIKSLVSLYSKKLFQGAKKIFSSSAHISNSEASSTSQNKFSGMMGIGKFIVSNGLSLYNFFSKFILLSIVMGCMNLLPLYGLDGGLAVVAIIEMITRRRLSIFALKILSIITMILILSLTIYVNLIEFKELFFG